MSWFSPSRPVLPPILDLMSERPDGDEDAQEQRRRVTRHSKRRVYPRIELSPDARAEPGPPCPACACEVTRASALAACPSCLGVYHQGCWPRGTRCPCERPAENGVHPLAAHRR